MFAAAMGESDAPAHSDAAAAGAFAGVWFDGENGLLLDVTVNPDGTLSARYDGGTEVLSVGNDGVAQGLDMALCREAGAVQIRRPQDAIAVTACKLDAPEAQDIAGHYRSEELGSSLEVLNAGGSWFAGFSGFLGKGPLMPLTPVGKDLWRLGCHRSLDAPSPGDWTLRVVRALDGTVESLRIGCWLARNVVFSR